MKTVTQTVRKYYKYQYSQFTRPNLSGYGLLGGGSFTCSDDGSSNSAYYPSYKAFNGEMTGTYNQWISATAIGNVTIYNPNPINVSQFTITNGSSGGNYAIGNIEFYVSNDNVNYTYVTTYTASIFTADYTHNISLNINGYYKYYKLRFQSNQGTTSPCYVREIGITATEQTITDGTSSDYDFYKDVTEYQHILQPIRKYYKYQDVAWTQPILHWNGFIGYDDFAVHASSVDGTRDAWQLFAGSITNYGWTTANTAYPHVYTMYSKNPLNITNIQVTNYDTSYVAKNWVIYGSNDGTNWTQLNSGENTITTTTWNITTNTNNYYNYYKIEFTNHNSGSGTYIRIGLFTLTATQKVVVESTSSDYDFYKDITEYKAVA